MKLKKATNLKEGKDCNKNIISLDDLQNLIAGVNGLSKYVTRKKLGKDIKSRLDKEAKEICTLGVKDIKKGSAILEIEAYPDGQQKLGREVNSENIMQDTIKLINDFQEDESRVPIEVGPYFDSLTKPLNKEKSNLSFSLYSASGIIIVKSKVLTTLSREKVQKILSRKRLEGGIMYGFLKEINLKDYSSKIQLFNKKFEKFSFDSELWEKIRDLLQQKVEVKFEGKGHNRKMIDIKTISSFQEKQKMTAKDLLNSGVVGALKHRDDLKNSVEYAKKLADDLLK